VIPTQEHVTLKFSYGPIDYFGYGLTLIGIPYIVIITKKNKRRHSEKQN